MLCSIMYNTNWYTEDLTTMMAIIGPTKAKIIPLSLGNQQLQKGYVDFWATCKISKCNVAIFHTRAHKYPQYVTHALISL